MEPNEIPDLMPDYSPEEMKELHQNFLRDIKEDRNNLSFWFPKVSDCGFAVPKTAVVPVPDETITAFGMEEPGDRNKILSFVHDKVMPALEGINGLPFIKNGTSSDKFQFNLCCPPDRDEATILRSIMEIQYDAFCFDKGGYSEIVLRERIPSPEDMPRIYGGMPLNCEVRLFYDFSARRPLYAVNYWDAGYCSERIHDNPVDGEAYDKRYPSLLSEYVRYAPLVIKEAAEHLKDVEGLEGVWSVDFLVDAKKKIWLIDMALGHQSAYWDFYKAWVCGHLDTLDGWLKQDGRDNVPYPWESMGQYVCERKEYILGLGVTFGENLRRAVLTRYTKDTGKPVGERELVSTELPEEKRTLLERHDRLVAQFPPDTRPDYVQEEIEFVRRICLALSLGNHLAKRTKPHPVPTVSI